MSGFHRLVLELGHGAADPETMRQAAAFAQLLDAELHALFVEDETLLHASALPFAREISPLSYQWRKLEPGRLEEEFRAAARHARGQLQDAAAAIGIRHHFEIRRGDLAVHVTDFCVASDVIVVASPSRETTHGSHRLRETASRSPAAVLFLPPMIGRMRGPVVAVAMDESAPSLAAARQIAARGHERLIVLTPAGTEIDDGVSIRRLAAAETQDISAALGDARERLIVITRLTDPSQTDIGTALAVERGVAVLMVEPVR